MQLARAPAAGRTLIAIDLLRFACALYVVAFHYAGFLPGTAHATILPTGWTSGSIAQDAANAGWIGVELFFVLSGFVIAWSAEGSAPGAFARRRAMRLLPAAWLCASVTALVLLADGAPTGAVLRRWLSSVAFDPIGRPIDRSYWTLGIEANFYIAIALLLRGGSDGARLERFAAMLGCASLAYWTATLLVPMPSIEHRVAQLTLLPHGCFFALGMMMRAHVRDGADGSRTALMLGMALAAGLEIVAHAAVFPIARLTVAWAAIAFMGGGVVLLQAERLQPMLARCVPARTAAMLGLMTYPLYLLHQQAGEIVARTLANAGVPRLAALGTAVAGVLGLSWLVARYGEPGVRAGLAAILDTVSRRRGRAQGSFPTASPSAG